MLVIPFSPKFESNDVTHEQSREESNPNPDDDYCAVPISDSWIGPCLSSGIDRIWRAVPEAAGYEVVTGGILAIGMGVSLLKAPPRISDLEQLENQEE